MIVGYARVSTDEQKLDLQISALEVAGCHRIYKDQGRSGQSFDREGLESALNSLQPGSTLVVWRLDRLGRSLSGLVQLIDQGNDLARKILGQAASPAGPDGDHLVADAAERPETDEHL